MIIKKTYDSSSIKILKGLEAVKKRPGMYIGDTDDGSGLHQMIFELIDNSIDEALVGFCNNISITINLDNSVTVEDDGRGIPVDLHVEENKSAAEIIMTTLHSGGKFDSNSYKVSGGLHGVGVSVVNALSESLILIVYKDNKIYQQNYSNGVPLSTIKEIGVTEKSGTSITFKPSSVIFSFIDFNFNTLFKRLRELSFLNPAVCLKLVDKRFCKEKLFNKSDGLKGFLNFINSEKKVINDCIYIKSSSRDIFVEAVIQWNESYKEMIFCYTNNIFQKDGGQHLSGFKSALTRTVNTYMDQENLSKNLKFSICGEDIREGLVAILSIKMENPRFSSQTKEKLVSSNVKFAVESIISENVRSFLLENPAQAKIISKKIIGAARSREAARRSKEIVRKRDRSLGHKVGALAGRRAGNHDAFFVTRRYHRIEKTTGFAGIINNRYITGNICLELIKP